MSNVFSALGRIGRDAEVRSTQSGTSVAGFPVAVDVGFGDHKQTMWLDASLWGKRAESGLVQYLVKGQQVHVIGEIGTREFQKRDGSAGFAVTLKVAEIDLVGGKGQDGGQAQGNQQGPQPQQNYGGQQNNSYQQPPQNQQPTQNQQPQGQQNHQAYGAPDPGSFDDFNSDIPF